MTLYDKLKALTAPCREVDARIRNIFVGDFAYCDANTGHTCSNYPKCSDGYGCGGEWGMSDERTSYPRDWRDDERLPYYTASLDAAVELVEREMPGNRYGWERIHTEYWAFVDPRLGCQNAPLPAVALLLALLDAKEIER